MGQGAAMALEDSAVLVEELTRDDGAALEMRLARYVARREKRVRRVQAQSRRIGRAAQVESGAIRAVRNAILRRLPVQPMERALTRLANESI